MQHLNSGRLQEILPGWAVRGFSRPSSSKSAIAAISTAPTHH